MSDVADKFPALAALSFDQLNARRRDLLGNKTTISDELPLDKLYELSAVATLLRRKASGPPRDKPKSSSPAPKSIMDLDV